MTDAIEPWLPGQSTTAERLNADRIIGAVVFDAARVTTQSIPNTTGGASTNDAVQWDEVVLDVFDGWDAGAPTQYVCRFAGWYEFTASAGFVTNTTGFRVGQLYRNGSMFSRTFSRTAAASGGGTQVPPRPRAVNLAVGDVVEYRVGQSSGDALNLTQDLGGGSYISARYVQPPSV